MRDPATRRDVDSGTDPATEQEDSNRCRQLVISEQDCNRIVLAAIMSVASPAKSLAPSLRDEEHAVFDLPCRHPSSWTAPEWLMARQLGGSPHHHLRAFGYANTAVSNTRHLASKIAW